MLEAHAIYGIDFSGARNAGNKIWISRGVADGKRVLIQECYRARELPNSERGLEVCLPALVNLITSNRNAAFGFDFPFGLPRSLVREETWEEFVLEFPTRFHAPDHFKTQCFAAAGNRELRRRTDVEAHTPFSPYNLRVYKQTYYGISKVLLPLVRDGDACVLPFQRPVSGKSWILEICPASTLRALGFNGVPYKGREELHWSNRRQILQAMERTGPIHIEEAEIRQTIIDDNGGDALDSVIAAMAVFTTLQNNREPSPMSPEYLIEGYVYWRV